MILFTFKIQEFIRQHYLEVVQIKELENPVKEYKWGERAIRECDKKNILKFVCKVSIFYLSLKLINNAFG